MKQQQLKHKKEAAAVDEENIKYTRFPHVGPIYVLLSSTVVRRHYAQVRLVPFFHYFFSCLCYPRAFCLYVGSCSDLPARLCCWVSPTVCGGTCKHCRRGASSPLLLWAACWRKGWTCCRFWKGLASWQAKSPYWVLSWGNFGVNWLSLSWFEQNLAWCKENLAWSEMIMARLTWIWHDMGCKFNSMIQVELDLFWAEFQKFFASILWLQFKRVNTWWFNNWAS